MKTRSLWGGVLHASTFSLTAVILTWPLAMSFPGFSVWILLATVSHVFIDHFKLKLDRTLVPMTIIYFFLDQFLHLVILLTVTWSIAPGYEAILHETLPLAHLAHTGFILGLCIYVAYAIDILLFYYDRSVDANLHALKYAYPRMGIRVVTVILLLTPFWMLSLGIILMRYFREKWRLVYDQRRFAIEHGFTLAMFLGYIVIERKFF